MCVDSNFGVNLCFESNPSCSLQYIMNASKSKLEQHIIDSYESFNSDFVYVILELENVTNKVLSVSPCKLCHSQLI